MVKFWYMGGPERYSHASSAVAQLEAQAVASDVTIPAEQVRAQALRDAGMNRWADVRADNTALFR